MALPRPTVLPEWATEDREDPVSGQYNVVQPPPEKILEGWSLGEKPNRQWWNWYQRTAGDWIAYFAENLDFDSDTFILTWSGLDIGSLTTNQAFYSKEGDRLYFTIHVIWSGNTDAGLLQITNMPYDAKSTPGLLQAIHVSRGIGPTLPGKGVLSVLTGPGTILGICC